MIYMSDQNNLRENEKRRGSVILPDTAFKRRQDWNKQFWDTGNKWAVENAKATGNW